MSSTFDFFIYVFLNRYRECIPLFAGQAERCIIKKYLTIPVSLKIVNREMQDAETFIKNPG